MPFDLVRSANTVSAAYAALTVVAVASIGAMTYNPLGSMQIFFTQPLLPSNVLDGFLVRYIAGLLVPFAAALYVLQDAAGRGRLGASTFRLLNLTIGTKCAMLALIYAATLAGGLGTGIMGVDAACQAALSGFCFWSWNAFKKK